MRLSVINRQCFGRSADTPLTACRIPARTVGVFSLGALVAISACAQPNPDPRSAESEVRYEYCSGGRVNDCFTLFPALSAARDECKSMLSMLNSFGAASHPATCELSVQPNSEIRKPNWETLEVADNLPLVYRLDSTYSPRAATNERLLSLSFDEWRVQFIREIAEGTIAPTLLRARLRFASNELVSVLGYTRRETACTRESVESSGSSGGGIGRRVYVYDESSGELEVADDLTPINVGLNELVEFRGRFFLVKSWFTPRNERRDARDDINMFEILPEPRSGWSTYTISRAMPMQCEFRATFPAAE